MLHLIPGFLKWVCKHWEVGFFPKNCQQISPFLPQTDTSIHTGEWYHQTQFLSSQPTSCHLDSRHPDTKRENFSQVPANTEAPAHAPGRAPGRRNRPGNRLNQIFPLLMLHLGLCTTFLRHAGEVRGRLQGGEWTPNHPNSTNP